MRATSKWIARLGCGPRASIWAGSRVGEPLNRFKSASMLELRLLSLRPSSGHAQAIALCQPFLRGLRQDRRVFFFKLVMHARKFNVAQKAHFLALAPNAADEACCSAGDESCPLHRSVITEKCDYREVHHSKRRPTNAGLHPEPPFHKHVQQNATKQQRTCWKHPCCRWMCWRQQGLPCHDQWKGRPAHHDRTGSS